MGCNIYVTKTKTVISFPAFVVAYAINRTIVMSVSAKI